MMHIENISEKTQEFSGSRRGFLQGMLGAGAFVLSVRWMPDQLLAATVNGNPADAMSNAVLHPGVYLAVDTDGTAYVVAHRTELHMVVHKNSEKKLGYGELAAAAAKQEVPKKEELKPKPGSAWRYIGKDTAGYDLKDLCTGKGVFGHDTHMAGMLYASVLHPPVLGSAVKSVDDKAALLVGGVKQTATIPTFKPPVLYQALGGVAVLADNTWAAMQGRKKLQVEWEESSHRVFNSGAYRKQLQETAQKPGKVVREVGNVDAAFAQGGRIIEAEYYAPLLAHASMEPPAALAVYRDGKVEAWAPTQSPVGARDAIAAAVGVPKADVTVHVTLLGGAFGRKSFPDYAVEAAVLSKKT